MARVGSLVVDLIAQTASFNTNLNKAASNLNSQASRMNRSLQGVEARMAGFQRVAVGAFAVLGGSALVGNIVRMNREMAVFQTQLVTATGSANGAKVAFGALQQFAATTPFQLTEVVDAFVKLKNLGLDPSQAALTSYGNTASALGKSLNQMIEAVADAATGEFERLKEFGIRASKEGNQVAFTFQGVTTKVAFNANSIADYLRNIGDVNFAGSMERQSKTLDGALSNLQDSVFSVATAFGEGGFNDAIADAARAMSDASGDAQKLARDFGKMAGDIISAAGDVARFFKDNPTLTGILLGSAGGARIGSVIPGVGTSIGALVGGAVGGVTAQFNDPDNSRRELVATNRNIIAQLKESDNRITPAIKQMLAHRESLKRELGMANAGVVAAANSADPLAGFGGGGGASGSGGTGGGASANDKTAKAQAKLREETQRLVESLIPAEARAREYQETQRALEKAVDSGATTTDHYTLAMTALHNKLNELPPDIEATALSIADMTHGLEYLQPQFDAAADSVARMAARGTVHIAELNRRATEFADGLTAAFGRAGQALLDFRSPLDVVRGLVGDLAAQLQQTFIINPFQDWVKANVANPIAGKLMTAAPADGPMQQFIGTVNGARTSIQIFGEAAGRAAAQLGALSLPSGSVAPVFTPSSFTAVNDNLFTLASATAGSTQALRDQAIGLGQFGSGLNAVLSMISGGGGGGLGSLIGLGASLAGSFFGGGNASTGAFPGGGPIVKVATGGFITGPGTGTSDSIDAKVSNGEYVNNAASVRKFGVSFFDSLNRGVMPRAFADGGFVGYHNAVRDMGPANDRGSGGTWNVNIAVNGPMTDRDARASGMQIAAVLQREQAKAAKRGFAA